MRKKLEKNFHGEKAKKEEGREYKGKREYRGKGKGATVEMFLRYSADSNQRFASLLTFVWSLGF